MRLAVDVMGGDHGCGVVIEGVKRALSTGLDISSVYLVGDEGQIQQGLAQSALRDSRIHVVHASEVLTMDDKPAVALRRKKDCSIARAVELVDQKKADAIISLGNTGGIFAAATFKLGRIEGVDRGGIATVIPTPEHEFVLLDAGANIECKPLNLLHYAVMGSVYSREILGYKKPRVGILSIGTEESKGNELTLSAFKLCQKADLNFIGNVEGHDLFHNRVDVVVCDGFVGNIVLKTCESLATSMFSFIRSELTKSYKRQLGALLAKNAFRAIKRRMDPEAYGGAPMLGFNGMVMKAHGSARERAISSAIRVASETVRHHVNDIIAHDIAAANAKVAVILADPASVPASAN
jgi:glycerol-3-phosphate acyltransferase PlsX